MTGEGVKRLAFSETFLEELVARNDIVDVVGSYVQLTKRSGNNLFGLCPFHNEKTPSFSVSVDKQIYHCFGCGKGGGVINFIMEIEGLGFREAVEFLAKRAGIQVPDDDTPPEVKNRRARLLDANRDAARFYFEMLSKSDGAGALQYIKKRGISKTMVRKFGLGVAPDRWTALCDALTAKGYTYQELFTAGLCKRGKSGGFYDTFRNRLMFPVIDIKGNVIAFSGRALGDNEPKYLNSADTPVFSKSRNLFAMNLAKKSKLGMIILAEGNVDVVSLHQAGFDCAVASLGTSLTPEQAKLISRYTSRVIIAYDSDGAGVKAAQRAIGILEENGLEVKVLRVYGAKDPDEFIRAKGAEAFKRLIESSENHIEYRLETLKSGFDTETDDGKLQYMRRAVNMLAGLPNSLEREIYAGKVAQEMGISSQSVISEVNKARRRLIAQEKKKREEKMMRPKDEYQAKSRDLRYDSVVSAAAEEGVIRLILLDPELAHKAEELDEKEFSSPFLGALFRDITDRIKSGRDISVGALSVGLERDQAEHLAQIVQRPESVPEGEKALADYIEKIRTENLKKTSKDNLRAIAEMYKEKKGYGGH